MTFLEHVNDCVHLSLGPIQRILLATDGTLTDTIEAIFGEPIGLRKIATEVTPARSGLEWLEVRIGEPLLHRRILLFGRRTRYNYVYAESILVIGRLPADLRDRLMNSDIPLGRLWTEQRLESCKELLSVSSTHMSLLTRYFAYTASDFLSRTYRLISGGRPVVLISEYVPREYPPEVANYASGGVR